MRRTLVALALTLAAPSASAQIAVARSRPVLVPDVSQREIEIVYSFTGARLLLFGAILYPRGRPPADTVPTDIVVVVRGPDRPVRVREKAKRAGMWVNAASLRFATAPSFYALAAPRPIAEIVDAPIRRRHELGLDSLRLGPARAPRPVQDRFAAGLIALQSAAGLYHEASDSVGITDGVLYRADVTIPARVPVGRFTARTYLIRNGRVLAIATRGIEIRKGGFERFVAMAANRDPVRYGLVTVALSVLLGWGAGWVARRI